FFQAEDGIRDDLVTGVQTCALPISRLVTLLEELQRTPQPTHGGVEHRLADERQLAEQLQGVPQVLAGSLEGGIALGAAAALQGEIGRASCRGRGWSWVGVGAVRGRE